MIIEPDHGTLKIKYRHYRAAGEETKRTPEQNLLISVLKIAIADACAERYLGSDYTEYWHRNAIAWLGLNRPVRPEELVEPEPFTFAWTCDALGLDFIIMRRAIRESIKEGRAWQILRFSKMSP